MLTIFTNGRVIDASAKNGNHVADCMIIKGDQIYFTGSSQDETVVQAKSNGATVEDLGGRNIIPGFIDGHMHLLMFGQFLNKISIEKCQNLDEIRSTIKEATKKRPDAKHILCSGWMQASTDGLALASMLDGLDDLNRPIFIDSKDLHSVWCNSVALKELNIQDTPNPPGGEIHRDENGNPTGLLSEGAAVGIAWPHLANIDPLEEQMNHIRKAVQTYNEAGYTGMIEMATDENIFRCVLALKQQEFLPIRLAMHWIIKPCATDAENLAQVDRAIALHKQYNLETSPDFRIAGIKMICDGVIDACTASLSEPYCSNNTNADPLWPADHLKAVVHHADTAGLQCALHAIGDAAVTLAIDTLSTLPTSTNPKTNHPVPSRRHRIEHLELTSPIDAKRLGDLGITASIQPVHSDPAILRAWPKLLGSDRLRRAFAYKDFHDHGANIAIGTDSPTAPHRPFPNLYNATTRRSAREPENTATTNGESQQLTVMQALAAATYGSAYSCFAEKVVGKLDVGMKADFVVVESTLEAGDLLSAKVWETWFDGKCVYKREKEEENKT